MLYRIKTIGGTKKKVPLAGSTPAGLPVGSILSTYKKIQPYNYLYCDGSTFDETQYPELYLYLGTNVLPDYRECVQVGAEKNTTDIFDSTETDPSTGLPGTQSHDVFTQGQFKDDRIQNITGSIQLSATPQATTGAFGATQYAWAAPNASGYSSTITFDASKVARAGETTRTKEKAVYYYIKAVDGVDIADEDTFLNTVVNTIQDAQSYSTTEEKTGGKWIDGKDIYRKTYYSATNWSNGTIIDTISNISSIIDVRDITTFSLTGFSYVNYGNDGGNYAMTSINLTTGAIKVERGANFANSLPSTVIVEYTKNE